MSKAPRVFLLLFITSLIQIRYSYASHVEAKVSGSFDFSSGTVFYKKNEKKNTDPKFIFLTKACFYSDIKYIIDKAIDKANFVGLYLNIKPTAKASFTSGSYIYSTSKLGKFELGSPKEAGKKIQITSLNLAKSKSWESFVNLKDLKYKNASFITGTKIQINKDSKHNEFSRKISYFTPKLFDKIQFGISYIPDSENIGYGPQNMANPTKYTYYMDDGLKAEIHSSLKNAISYGVSFENSLTENVDFKLAFDGKYGKPAKKAEIKPKNGPSKEVNLSDFNIYNIGGIITRGCFSYSASYGNLNKSLTSEQIHKNNRDSSWFGLGIAYDQGPVGAAINYYNSDNMGSKLSLISFSTDYKIRKGLKTYFETSFYKTEINEKKDSKNSGTILVLGMKVSF
jgi:hypothetical protein